MEASRPVNRQASLNDLGGMMRERRDSQTGQREDRGSSRRTSLDRGATMPDLAGLMNGGSPMSAPTTRRVLPARKEPVDTDPDGIVIMPTPSTQEVLVQDEEPLQKMGVMAGSGFSAASMLPIANVKPMAFDQLSVAATTTDALGKWDALTTQFTSGTGQKGGDPFAMFPALAPPAPPTPKKTQTESAAGFEGKLSNGSIGAPQAATPHGSVPLWRALEKMAERKSRFETQADGVAAAHSHTARGAAAKKLISNYQAVLFDITNPSPISQHLLARLDDSARPHVDEALREVARRLLGRVPGSEQLEVRLDPYNRAQVDAWIGTAQYLDSRIQATPEDKPGRPPDMPPESAAAMKAVLREVGGMAVPITLRASAPQWAMLHRLLEEAVPFPFHSEAEGAAAAHSHAARQEAAAKLITNHVNVFRDVCNPWPTQNIIGIPLTQHELQRVGKRRSTPNPGQ